jgi:hypothetical protein
MDNHLAEVASPERDEVGLAMEKRNLPKRVRTKEGQYDF